MRRTSYTQPAPNFCPKGRKTHQTMLTVGAVEVSRVAELELELPGTLLPDWRSELANEHLDWLLPRFYVPNRDRFPVSIHSWLLRSGTKTILIDTCAGNGKTRPTYRRLERLDTPYLDRLASAGVRPEDVDFVICTHLHVDHVGWNTTYVEGQWRPTFPNAQYILSRLDCEARDPAHGHAREGTPEHAIYADSVLPVMEAGQARIVDGDEEVDEYIDLVPARGHSPGQMAVRVQSRGCEALFVGDVMHHPLQIRFPEWNSRLCEDGENARKTRRRILEHCAAHGSLLLPAHFAAPHYGRVCRSGNSYAFVPGDKPV